MSNYSECPSCHRKASGGFLGGCYIQLHKCRSKGHIFCDNCKNGDCCPKCGSSDISWKFDQAYTKD